MTKEITPLSYRDRMASRFARMIGSTFGKISLKKKSPIIQYVSFTEGYKAKIRRPKWRYDLIFNIAIKSWVYRQTERAIVQEVIVPEVKLTRSFANKCLNPICEMEFETEVEECVQCGGTEFRTPDLTQRKKAQDLMDAPNPDYSFTELNRSALKWHIMLDDTYISIAYKESPKTDEKGEVKQTRTPSEVYVEDSRFTFPVANMYGKYGNDEYFCRECYDPKTDNIVIAEQGKPEPTVCPDCNGYLQQTCYVIQFQDEIKYRYGCDEIVQESTERMLPELFGNPKIVSVWKLMSTIDHYDDYVEEVYSEGTTGGILAVPGMDREGIAELQADIAKAIQESNTSDIVTGQAQVSKKVHTILIGVLDKPPEFIPIMPDSDKLQSLDVYKLYRDSISGVFGVTPVFVGVIESGKSGNNPRMQIDVQKGTTEENQQFLSDLWNTKIFPIFDIYDWEIQFGAIEQVDDLRTAQVWRERGTAAKTFIELGFEVTLDEHGALEVSQERDEEKETEEPQEEVEPMQDEVSEESGDWNPTKTKLIDEPESAKKIRLKLEADLGKIIDEAKKKNSVKASYAEAKKVMNQAHLDLIEASRAALSSTLETKLPTLPAHIMKKLDQLTKERLKDFRKLLKEELKRES